MICGPFCRSGNVVANSGGFSAIEDLHLVGFQNKMFWLFACCVEQWGLWKALGRSDLTLKIFFHSQQILSSFLNYSTRERTGDHFQDSLYFAL